MASAPRTQQYGQEKWGRLSHGLIVADWLCGLEKKRSAVARTQQRCAHAVATIPWRPVSSTDFSLCPRTRPSELMITIRARLGALDPNHQRISLKRRTCRAAAENVSKQAEDRLNSHPRRNRATSSVVR